MKKYLILQIKRAYKVPGNSDEKIHTCRYILLYSHILWRPVSFLKNGQERNIWTQSGRRPKVCIQSSNCWTSGKQCLPVKVENTSVVESKGDDCRQKYKTPVPSDQRQLKEGVRLGMLQWVGAAVVLWRAHLERLQSIILQTYEPA